MILAIFKLTPNHIELSILFSWIDPGRWLIIFWFIASKYDGWVLIGGMGGYKNEYGKLDLHIHIIQALTLVLPSLFL